MGGVVGVALRGFGGCLPGGCLCAADGQVCLGWCVSVWGCVLGVLSCIVGGSGGAALWVKCAAVR